MESVHLVRTKIPQPAVDSGVPYRFVWHGLFRAMFGRVSRRRLCAGICWSFGPPGCFPLGVAKGLGVAWFGWFWLEWCITASQLGYITGGGFALPRYLPVTPSS